MHDKVIITVRSGQSMSHVQEYYLNLKLSTSAQFVQMEISGRDSNNVNKMRKIMKTMTTV